MPTGNQRSRGGIPWWRTEPDLSPPPVVRQPEMFTPKPVVSQGVVLGIAKTPEQLAALTQQKNECDRDSRL